MANPLGDFFDLQVTMDTEQKLYAFNQAVVFFYRRRSQH